MPNESEVVFQFKRTQFPIKLAFALTVNKSQGQTIKKVGFYINYPLFTHGQLYVALSRVTNREFIKIMIGPRKYKNKFGFFINNVVFKSVFE